MLRFVAGARAAKMGRPGAGAAKSGATPKVRGPGVDFVFSISQSQHSTGPVPAFVCSCYHIQYSAGASR